jgi:hypothetical protein
VDLAAVNAPVPAGIAVAFEGEAPQPLGFTEIFDLLVGMADVPVGADKAQRIAGRATLTDLAPGLDPAIFAVLAEQPELGLVGHSRTVQAGFEPPQGVVPVFGVEQVRHSRPAVSSGV